MESLDNDEQVNGEKGCSNRRISWDEGATVSGTNGGDGGSLFELSG